MSASITHAKMDAVQLIVMILKSSALQFLSLVGTLAISGAILTWIARRTTSIYRQFVFPKFGLYAFGSLGIPVHELSHYLFCKLFRLDVAKIKWFDPKGRGGAHGAVVHRYDPWNILHRIGHLFVGFAPILLAPVLIGVLCTWLLPGISAHTFAGMATIEPTLGGVLCLYAVFAISSHLDLSREDMNVAASGLAPLFFVLVCANGLAAVLRFDLHGWLVSGGARLLTYWTWALGLTAMASLLHFALAWSATSLIHVVIRRPAINPFRD